VGPTIFNHPKSFHLQRLPDLRPQQINAAGLLCEKRPLAFLLLKYDLLQLHSVLCSCAAPPHQPQRVLLVGLLHVCTPLVSPSVCACRRLTASSSSLGGLLVKPVGGLLIKPEACRRPPRARCRRSPRVATLGAVDVNCHALDGASSQKNTGRRENTERRGALLLPPPCFVGGVAGCAGAETVLVTPVKSTYGE
jgi:hypothetical protein